MLNFYPFPTFSNNINGAENRVSLSCATSEAISLTQRTGSIPSQASDIDTPSSISALTAGGHVRTASLDCTGHTRSYSSGSAKAFLSLRKVNNQFICWISKCITVGDTICILYLYTVFKLKKMNGCKICIIYCIRI